MPMLVGALATFARYAFAAATPAASEVCVAVADPDEVAIDVLLLDVLLLEHAAAAMVTAEIHSAITAMRLDMSAFLS